MSECIIRQIDLYKLRVPLKDPFVISLETIKHANNVVVRMTTRDGRTAFGECSPYRSIAGETQAAAFEVGRELARLLVGEPALAIERVLDRLDRHITGNHCIKSAFDMALYDLAAQYTGLPLYAFLGGANDRSLQTDMTVGIGRPEKMAADARRFQQQGFPAIKVKLGTDTDADLARIRAIRQAVGRLIPLRIDANQGWDVPTAIRTLRALAPHEIEYCEAPIPRARIDDLPIVRRHSPIPIMADESLFDHYDAFRLASRQACDYFNIKLAKSGGIRNALRIIAIAEGAGIGAQVGCFSETRLGITALAHLALARRAVHHYDMDSFLMLAEDPVRGGIEYSAGGRIKAPDTPGLGAGFDTAYLEKLEKITISEVAG